MHNYDTITIVIRIIRDVEMTIIPVYYKQDTQTSETHSYVTANSRKHTKVGLTVIKSQPSGYEPCYKAGKTYEDYHIIQIVQRNEFTECQHIQTHRQRHVDHHASFYLIPLVRYWKPS